jgi:hypothetical protein
MLFTKIELKGEENVVVEKMLFTNPKRREMIKEGDQLNFF